MALKSLVSNLVSDVTGQHSHDGHSTCLADGHHGHAFGPMASSFTAFFPDAADPHHSDHFLPSISQDTVHQGDAAHLDQFDHLPVNSLCLLRNMALKSLVSNLVSDVTGQHSHDGHSTCLADGHHGHAFGPMASSFTAFFPDAVDPHHSDHFLPSISQDTVHQGDAAHLDQFDQSLLATRRPKTYVSFHEHKEEEKEGE
eukprot:Skav203207  [mRNA]  locus=scaffold1148:75653:79031:- [translate_table: standard]